MKKISILSTLFLFVFSNLIAAPKAYYSNTPFVFVEQGVEYAVFKNGEFDFNIINTSSSSVTYRNQNGSISFNSGYNYTPFIQKNRYGDIINIDHTPIYYNRVGRVIQIGNVHIQYNRLGFVNAVGNLHIQYQDYGNRYVCTGYVNRFNHHYTPRYTRYRKPVVHHHLYTSPNRRPKYYSNYTSNNYRSKKYYQPKYNRHYSYKQKNKSTNYKKLKQQKNRTTVRSYSYRDNNNYRRR